jgi:hypothetical protein
MNTRTAISTLKYMKSNAITEIQVQDFKSFMKLIAEYDLWDELEYHLKAEGCTSFMIGVEPMRVVGNRLQEKIVTGDLPTNLHAIQLCGCNGTMSPGTGPKTPGDAGSKPK